MKPLLLLSILTIFTGCKTEPEPEPCPNRQYHDTFSDKEEIKEFITKRITENGNK